MKKISFLLVVFLMATGITMAQPPQKGERKQMDPKARAEKMTERMVKEYGLDDAQKDKLLTLNLTMTEKMGDRPGGNHHKKNHRNAKKEKVNQETSKEEVEKSDKTREEREIAMKESRETYENELKEIMTAEQFSAFKAKQDEREEKMKDSHKDRKERKDEKE